MTIEEILRLRTNASMGPFLVEPFGDNWSVVTAAGKRIAVVRRRADADLFAASLDMIAHVEDYDEQLRDAMSRIDDGYANGENLGEVVEAQREKMERCSDQIERATFEIGERLQSLVKALREQP